MKLAPQDFNDRRPFRCEGRRRCFCIKHKLWRDGRAERKRTAQSLRRLRHDRPSDLPDVLIRF